MYLCGELSWQATRSKDVFSKHVESVLAKCAKLRSLSADLQKNYAECPTAKKFLGSMSGGAIHSDSPVPFLASEIELQIVMRPRAILQLNADLQTLDNEYNKLGDLAARGERDDHNDA